MSRSGTMPCQRRQWAGVCVCIWVCWPGVLERDGAVMARLMHLYVCMKLSEGPEHHNMFVSYTSQWCRARRMASMRRDVHVGRARQAT